MPCVELTRFGPVKTVQAARLAVGHLYVRPRTDPIIRARRTGGWSLRSGTTHVGGSPHGAQAAVATVRPREFC